MCSLSTWASDIAVNTAFGHRLEHVAIGKRVLKPAWQTQSCYLWRERWGGTREGEKPWAERAWALRWDWPQT